MISAHADRTNGTTYVKSRPALDDIGALVVLIGLIIGALALGYNHDHISLQTAVHTTKMSSLLYEQPDLSPSGQQAEEYPPFDEPPPEDPW